MINVMLQETALLPGYCLVWPAPIPFQVLRLYNTYSPTLVDTNPICTHLQHVSKTMCQLWTVTCLLKMHMSI